MTDFNPDGDTIQYGTISVSGIYAITVDGAQGGTGGHGDGGLGAVVSGDIYLNAGAVLEIVVGSEGASDSGGGGGGGGGGSFVIETSDGTISVDTILAIAGGGGGGGGVFSGATGGGGQTGSTGASGGGAYYGAGGKGGGPGGGGLSGGGGGGYTGGAAVAGSTGASGGTGGIAFSGGAATSDGGDGGFGGGGGGGQYGGGGGGGYGGGGGGGKSGTSGGGGGGSYDAHLTGAMAQGGTHSGDGFVSLTEVSCFLEGTRIVTPAGERAVESLTLGDLVTTADGRSAPVRWIGRRTLTADGERGYRFADPLIYLPIRIRAGALGENVPVRDLLVSMDHAVLIDGLLVQAGALVNDISVFRETRLPETVTYYHIELADHALVLAEGVAAETFVDNANRMGFDNWAEHEALYGDAPAIMEMPYPRVQSFRQLPVEIRRQMSDRARMLADAPRRLLVA